MKLDLSHLENEPLRFDEKLSLPPDSLDEDQVAGEVEVCLKGTVLRVGDGYVAEGTVTAAGDLLCSRCLAPVPWHMEDHFSSEYRHPSQAPGEGEFVVQDGDLDVAFLQNHELDLGDMATEQVMLSLPMRIVCDEGCAGLCPRCGANRNLEGACRCEPEIDPRWDALRHAAGSSSAN